MERAMFGMILKDKKILTKIKVKNTEAIKQQNEICIYLHALPRAGYDTRSK